MAIPGYRHWRSPVSIWGGRAAPEQQYLQYPQLSCPQRLLASAYSFGAVQGQS